MSRWKKFLTILVMVSTAITPGVLEGVNALPPLTPGESINSCLGEEQVQAKAESIAKLITVKIIHRPDQNGHYLPLGSGVLVSLAGDTYGVITNNHVLQGGTAPYWIETHDGTYHPVTTVKDKTWFSGKDLALLEFQSKKRYNRATKVHSIPRAGVVMAAGFPLSPEAPRQPRGKQPTDVDLAIKTGQITQVLTKPLEGGYRIGYTSDVRKGMSGGPVLNCRGELVGINGRHAHPIWGNPYVFADGSFATPQQEEAFSPYSWGIPVSDFHL